MQRGGDCLIDSCDYSDYERATVIHDLSVPVPDNLKNKYTCVIDGGTLEHVFDYLVGLKNVMDMVAIGGHLILMTPGNNWFGHGFYQFSPELFYTALSEENGFIGTKVFCNNGRKWYLIENPSDTARPTGAIPKWGVLLHVVSKKVAEVPNKISIYQDIYERAWEQGSSMNQGATRLSAFLRDTSMKLLPFEQRISLLRLYLKVRNMKRFKEDFKQITLRY